MLESLSLLSEVGGVGGVGGGERGGVVDTVEPVGVVLVDGTYASIGG